MTAVLQIRGLSKRFGEFTALHDVDVTVVPGAVHAIIGPNGAGKTTFVNVVTGLHQATGGTVSLMGEDITRLSAFQIARLGLVRTFQITSLFLEMTVRENIEIALVSQRKYASHRVGGAATSTRSVDQLLTLVGLTRIAEQLVQNISHGDQRLLELGVSLAMQPLVLLMDEPTAGMSPAETRSFIDLVNDKLRGQCTCVLIEHDMDVVMGTSDRITVLAAGRTLADGSPHEIVANSLVQEAYLGRAQD